MASNPIKRRARQSFFLGFLIALVIMAIVVMLLFSRISALKKENKKLKILGPQVTFYTIARDIEEGDVVTVEDLVPASLQLAAASATMDISNYIDPSIFEGEDEEGNPVELTYTAKVKIYQGTLATLSLLQEGGIDNDERMVEYNMIVLPSQLNNGDYIDIRLRYPNGTENVVLAKKKVEQCTTSSVWIRMKEIDILSINSAIVDAYTIEGSQLRATVYTNPLMQEASEQTYPVNNAVLTQITYNPNILVEARNALIQKWNVTSDPNSGLTDFVAKRREIESYIEPDPEEKIKEIDRGYTQEATDMNNARNDYVTALEGSGVVGTTY